MGSRDTAKQRAKVRRHNEHLVRRSPILSNGAKLLWLELSAWAWDEPVCFPSQELLRAATNASRYSLTRWLRELQAAQILTVERQQRGNRYVLATEIPEAVCDPARGFNSKLVAMVRGEKAAGVYVAEMPHGDAQDEKSVLHERTSHVAEMPHDPPTPCGISATCHVAEMPHHDDEVVQGKYIKEEVREVNQEEVREFRNGPHAQQKTKSDSGVVQEHEGDTANSLKRKSKTYVRLRTQVEDPSDLMEDPPPRKPPKRKPRKKRAANSDLVATVGEDRRTASQAADGTKSVEVSPPPPEQPTDVLWLLRDEVLEKYGAKGAKGIPMDLSRKERGQVRNVLLNKFAPDVVISMIRVLVWDWEVARSVCFPFREQVSFPTFESLIQYQETLSSAVETGLKYDGARRGEWITYANRYLKNASPIKGPDPF